MRIDVKSSKSQVRDIPFSIDKYEKADITQNPKDGKIMPLSDRPMKIYFPKDYNKNEK